GQLTSSGAACGTGTVNSGTQGQVAFYNSSTNAVSGTSTLTIGSNSFVGFGTTSPGALVSLALNGVASTTRPDIASSSLFLSGINLTYGSSSTTTIPNSLVNAWSIATSSDVGSSPLLSFDTSNGKIGIGTSTPWGKLSIQNTSANFPSFVVATSSILGTAPLLLVDATTSGLLDYTRIAIGTTTLWGTGGIRDQLTVAGRIYSTWQYASCDLAGLSNGGSISSNTPNMCGILFSTGGGSITAPVASVGTNFYRLQTNAAVTGDQQFTSGGDMIQASSSPVVEAWLRPSGGTTGSKYIFGFQAGQVINKATSTDIVEFIASTTSNWIAATRKAGVETDVDTTIVPDANNFHKFRIEVATSTENVANNSVANFFIDGALVAQITTNIPQVSLAVETGVANTNGSSAQKTFDIQLFRLWVDEPLIRGGDSLGSLTEPKSDLTQFQPWVGASYGQTYFSDDTLDDGMLVSFDTSGALKVRRTQSINESKIAGVVSNNAQVLGQEARGWGMAHVANYGRVRVNVSTENGDIHIGDRITSSSQAGIGMLASSTDNSIGIALEDFNARSAPNDFTLASASYKDATVGGKSVHTGQVLISLAPAAGTIDNNLNRMATDLTNAWSVDQQSGKVNVNFQGDVNLNGNNIINVSQIVSQNGLWRIDDTGHMVMKYINTDHLTVGSSAAPTGITLFDETTKQPYCLAINNGTITSAPGTCESQAEAPMPVETPPTDTSATTTAPTDTAATDTATTTEVTAPADITTTTATTDTSASGTSDATTADTITQTANETTASSTSP
ncbi:MAG: hypothetical protein HY220_01255, partial [Candidatus Sungbacteria bacterium]|nr:hypothetical protein [Candidatus Sungbacteria bacterium]